MSLLSIKLPTIPTTHPLPFGRGGPRQGGGYWFVDNLKAHPVLQVEENKLRKEVYPCRLKKSVAAL